MTIDNTDLSIVPWKAYLKLTAESLLTFYLATFCAAMFFTHQGAQYIFLSIWLVLTYLFVIVVCAKRLFSKLSMPALMLVIPIAPLLALIIVVSLIPLVEYLQ